MLLSRKLWTRWIFWGHDLGRDFSLGQDLQLHFGLQGDILYHFRTVIVKINMKKSQEKIEYTQKRLRISFYVEVLRPNKQPLRSIKYAPTTNAQHCIRCNICHKPQNDICYRFCAVIVCIKWSNSNFSRYILFFSIFAEMMYGIWQFFAGFLSLSNFSSDPRVRNGNVMHICFLSTKTF